MRVYQLSHWLFLSTLNQRLLFTEVIAFAIFTKLLIHEKQTNMKKTIFKEWRIKTHTKQKYFRHIDYPQECLKNHSIAKGFNTRNKTTYIDEEIRKKNTELNNNTVADYLPLLIEWINSNISVLGTEI